MPGLTCVGTFMENSEMACCFAQDNTDFAPLPTLVEFSLSEEPADRPSSSASTRRQTKKTRCVMRLLHQLGDVRLVTFKSEVGNQQLQSEDRISFLLCFAVVLDQINITNQSD